MRLPPLRRHGGGRPSGAPAPALRRPQRESVIAAASAVGLSFLSSLLIVAGGPAVRLSVAIVMALLLLTLARSRPAVGIMATFAFLVFLATLRRVLIGASPWLSADPLLLVAPAVAVVLVVQALALDRRAVAPDLVSKLVVVVLTITFLEAANPQGGGLTAGISGLLFMAVPLFWFIPGREFLRDADVERLLGVVVGLGVIVACYGLFQNFVGHPPWDVSWLNLPAVAEYSSLNVGGEIRAFASFASFGEYGLFLGTAVVVAVWLALGGKTAAALPIPLLAVALFLSSGRQPLILTIVAVVVMLGLRTGRPRTALLVTVTVLAVAFAGVYAGRSLLESTGASSGELVSHQLSGLANPLDPDSSTLLIHLDLVIAGVKAGVSHPYGLGTAVTNNAAGLTSDSGTRGGILDSETTLGVDSSGTDIDISNAFVAFGIVGGLIYVLLIVAVMAAAVSAYFRGQTVLLPIIGILVVNLGHWANGGNYALSALIWMLIGVVAARGRRAAT